MDKKGGQTSYRLKSALVHGGPLPRKVFKDCAIQLVDALGYLRDKQVMHRDIRPDNILVDPGTGQVRLADFAHPER